MKHNRIYRKSIAAVMALTICMTGMNMGGIPLTATVNAADSSDPRICIDINGNDGRKPSYSKNAENWIVAGGSSSSFTMNGVTFKLSNGGSAGGDLRSVNYKGLQESTEYGTPTLTMDGVTIEDGDNGGTIKLEISGLSAGTHTLKTWHSCVDNATASSVSVSINGQTTATGVKCPTRVSSSDDAGMSYSAFNVSGGETVTVLIKPEGNGSQNNAWLNAIELDGADPFNSISRFTPIHQEKHLEIEDGLSWTAGQNAQSHDVYIGTDFSSVYNADTSSAEYKGNQTGTTYALDDSYTSLETYYWRVDEVGENGTVKGAVYSFQTARLAFPTAEGYGRYARGGRGGRVLHVTNLNDSGEGSLRWALEENDGPRIIVFDVGGIIELKSTLWIKENNGDVYVAGQTAPGDGITLIKHDFGGMGASDVVIRGIHVRVGDSNGESTGGMGLGSCNHSIVDHCSISWATDEGFSSRWAKNITFQRNIIAESLHDSVHYKDSDRNQTETHAFAASISGNIGSFHHNLLVHCTDRNWSLAGGVEADGLDYAGNLDISNNVVYNWLGRTTDGGIYRLNFVNNYYKMGPESRDMALLQLTDKVCSGLMKAYVSGNKMTDIKGNTKLSPSQDAWNAGRVESHQAFSDTRVDSPFWEDHIELQDADTAYADILSNVGANFQGLDKYDSRYINEVKNGTYTYKGSKQGKKGIIDSQNDVGGYPTASDLEHSTSGATNAQNDTDRDGMPNTWEEAHGLNPNDPSDGSIVSLSGDDYTNVEMYLNELAGDDINFNGRTISAYKQIEAESFDSQSGIIVEECSEGGQDVGYAENGDYIKFNRVDFEDGAKSVSMRVSSQSGGTIELYAGSLDGTPIGTYDVEGTGSWSDWQTIEFNVTPTSGKQSLFVRFTGSDGFLVNLNHFVFSKSLLPMNGKLISALSINDNENCGDWSIAYDLKSGDKFFGDREVTYSEITPYLEGGEYIITAADSKIFTDDLAEFTAAADITVYVAIDNRVATIPAWLSAWEDTGDDIINSKQVTFSVYKKNFSTGELVTLGTNGQSQTCVNYTVIVTEQSAEVQKLKGDINIDGTVDILDAKLLQKYLAASEKTLPDSQAADIDENGTLNVFDLSLLRRELRK